jgi:hypothetical protein
MRVEYSQCATSQSSSSGARVSPTMAILPVWALLALSGEDNRCELITAQRSAQARSLRACASCRGLIGTRAADPSYLLDRNRAALGHV